MDNDKGQGLRNKIWEWFSRVIALPITGINNILKYTKIANNYF